MLKELSSLNPFVLTILATTFSWGMTALGAGGVFLFKEVSRKLLDAMLGFAAGVMIAASFWSLLAPAIEMSGAVGFVPWIPPVIGFLAGGAALWLIDKILPHVHIGFKRSQAEGIKTSWHKTFLLFLAITLHNFPEGMAIGVAIGAVYAGIPGASIAGALALAIGIGIQNFPEGFAVSMPFRREGVSKFRSFMYGQGSALVEPVAALIGVAAVIAMRPFLPFALAFAAGAMIYVSVEEIIPESQQHSTDVATFGTMLGLQ
jgi:zinc transporter, ZIP family